MLFKTHSAAVFGIDAHLVEVEVDISAGQPNFLTVGLPDAAVNLVRTVEASAGTRVDIVRLPGRSIVIRQ